MRLPATRCAALAAILILECFSARAEKAATSGNTAPAGPEAGTVTVQGQPVTEHFQAYGQIRPIALLPVHAVQPGVVAAMRVVPGSRVKAGQPLATLSGPEIRSLLVRRKSAVRSARIRLAAAKRLLAIERRQLSAQLSTLQSIAAAQSTVAAATAAFDTARTQLRVAKEMSTLRAPSAGTVLAVNAAAGERVAAGQTVLTLQASNRLWLKAAYYGADAASIRVGMKGQFRPATGGVPVPVRVAAVSAAIEPDGGESVGLLATDPVTRGTAAPATPWLNGQRGTVMLTGETRPMLAVPTRALILDRARWWVLVRTSKGDRPRAVVPGPTRGWQTFIERGLAPGERVVVENAFLEFHRGISHHYMPPD